MTGRREIHRRRTRLDQTFARMPPPTAEAEFQSDFARYLIVLIAGFLENAIEAVLLDLAQRRSSPEIAQYVGRQLGLWTNPNCDKICFLLGSFSSDWREKLEAFLIDEKRDGINGLIALRHKVAHGDYVGTTLHQAKNYYKIILSVVEYIVELVDPSPRLKRSSRSGDYGDSLLQSPIALPFVASLARSGAGRPN